MTEYVGAMFALDELGLWQGVHNPSTGWNGWACPLFTLDVCRDIAEVINALPDNCEVIKVTDSEVFSIYTDGDEVDTHEYEPVTIDGVNFYPLGSMGWVWEVTEQKCYGCLHSHRVISFDDAQGHPFCFDCETKVLGGK
jgi:hypothetical protein